MTMQITIKHDGPECHKAEIRVTDKKLHILSKGESIEVTMWQGVEVHVSEVQENTGPLPDNKPHNIMQLFEYKNLS